MSEYMMTIDGASVSGADGSFGVVNAATGEVFAEAPECSREQLDVAMETAQKAFGEGKDALELRRRVMYACADAIEAAAEEMGRIATMEQGHPLAMGIGS